MNIVETTPLEYDRLFGQNAICYNTGSFHELNRFKAEEVYYLVFGDKKIRMGLIVGLKNNRFYSPFSAPFGGFTVLDNRIPVEYVEEAVDVFLEYAGKRGVEGVTIGLPPLFYNESVLTKQHHVLLQKGFKLQVSDLNYVFYTANILKNYADTVLPGNSRRNLKIALSKNLGFQVGKKTADLHKVYEIIQINRESKGYYLSMTLEQVVEMSGIIPVDSFLVDLEGLEIASAIVFHVTPQILQVIYWGDLPEYASNKTMNFLTCKIFEYYQQKGFPVIDVGTAMWEGRPNYGLCSFKESIGCDIQPKTTYSIEFSR